jgi:hypothetical protein
MFGNAGLSVIKAGFNPSMPSDSGWRLEPISRYSHYHYAKIEAEERTSQVRFYQCGGYTDDGFWFSDSGSSDTLFGPDGFQGPCFQSPKYYIKMEREYFWTSGMSGPITYNIDLQAKIDWVDSAGFYGEDTVAYLELDFHKWDCSSTGRDTLAVLQAEDFAGDDSLTIFEYSFSLPETVIVDCDTSYETFTGNYALGVALILTTNGKRKVSVDYVKIYDYTGKGLAETDEYTDEIGELARYFSACGDTLWGWYTRDEPYFLNLPPAGRVLEIARDSGNVNWNAITAFCYGHINRYWFESLESAGGNDVIMPDIYPFTCNLDTGDTVSFTGYGTDWSIQNKLSSYYAQTCTSFYNASEEYGAEFWAMPQSFEGHDYIDEDYCSGCCWRRPTPSEFTCQTYIALASGARGIIYWKYDYTEASEYYVYGMREMVGDTLSRTSTWYAVRDRVNPYIKAIDSTYLTLTLDTAYAICYYENILPPAGSLIDTIYSIFNSSDSTSPDLGWFHVGEFKGEDDSKYIMLVNRACSQGPNDPSEAGSITAFVKLNPANLGLGDYVYIIDIAKGTNANDWVGYPETTYTATLNGTIPYTTVLSAGEGRLYKIVRTVEKVLSTNSHSLPSK